MKKHLPTTLLTVLAAMLIVTAVAKAATVSFAGQDWHTFKSTGALGQVWDPSMVTISGSTVTEGINGNKAGGIGSTHFFLYGKASAQFKITPGAGKFVILLKGHEGTPNNELDMAESKVGDSGRTQITATRHWGHGSANLQQARISGDFTQWHTVSVTWTSAAMIVSMDGKVFGTFTSHVSHTPMDMAIQTAGANVGGAGAPANLQVSNVTTS